MFFASSLHLHKDGTTSKNKIESDPNKPEISLYMYMCLFIEPWCTIDSLFSPHWAVLPMIIGVHIDRYIGDFLYILPTKTKKSPILVVITYQQTLHVIFTVSSSSVFCHAAVNSRHDIQITWPHGNNLGFSRYSTSSKQCGHLNSICTTASPPKIATMSVLLTIFTL